jgi:hydrogenase maturation protease
VSRVIVLGVGNLLLSDEGIGPTVIAYLKERWQFTPDVRLIDGATGGMDLMPLFEQADHLIVVDTVRGGAEPGALYRFTPEEVPETAGVRSRISAHDVSFMDAWVLARLVETPVPRMVILGVEPADISTPHVGLTSAVTARLPDVEALVLRELAEVGVVARRTS